MTLVTESHAPSVTKVGKKMGRPTLRKNGIPLAPHEKQKRYRDRLRRERARSYCEWYTPAQYIEAACRVLGTIDLDPASSEIAQTGVQAGRFFTKADNGLTQEWHGKVWLNPPYSGDLVGRFIEKLLLELRAGRTEQAILLVNAYPDTQWVSSCRYSQAARCASPLAASSFGQRTVAQINRQETARHFFITGTMQTNSERYSQALESLDEGSPPSMATA